MRVTNLLTLCYVPRLWWKHQPTYYYAYPYLRHLRAFHDEAMHSETVLSLTVMVTVAVGVTVRRQPSMPNTDYYAYLQGHHLPGTSACIAHWGC
jgi:hypothetical protein